MFRQASEKQLKGLEYLDLGILLFSGVMIAVLGMVQISLPLTWRITGKPVGGALASGEVTSMVVFAGCVFAAAVLWLIGHALTGWCWKQTSLLLPLLLMAIGGSFQSARGMNAFRDTLGLINFFSQVTLALLLVQVADKPWKQRLILAVVAATGVALAYRCWEQSRWEIPQTIAMVNKDPQALLQQQGITPGTYAAQQFLDRVNSRDVGGYFAVSNTAASYFILSIMATLGLILDRDSTIRKDWLYLAGAAALAAQIGGLLLTQSKGGIGSWLAALLLLLLLWLGRRFFSRYWKQSLVGATLLVILAVSAIITYGISHHRLPGNSLWLRWQYWQASAGMIRDYWLGGVGVDNFASHYPRYMIPSAPEVVQDPHSLPIKLWCEWGILSLAGFIWLLAAATIRLVRPVKHESSDISVNNDKPDQPPWLLLGLVIIVAVQVIRWCLSDFSGASFAQQASVLLVAFAVPGAIWLVAFTLLQRRAKPENNDKTQPDIQTAYEDNAAKTASKASFPSVLPILAVGCGLLGVLLHNCIDFAFFNPGVGMCFWTLLALLIARRNMVESKKFETLRLPAVKYLVCIVSLAGLIWYVQAVALPFALQQYHMKKAQRLIWQKQLGASLVEARKAKYCYQAYPDAADFLSRLYFALWEGTASRRDDYFAAARENMLLASRDDPYNYKYFRQLGQLYQEAARRFAHRRRDNLIQAATYFQQAVTRFPGKSELLIEYGKVLLKLNEKQQALTVLEKALLIEDEFLRQQQQMYPLRKKLELVPRLDPRLRNWVREQVQLLRKGVKDGENE